MKKVASTDDFTIYQRRDGRYAVKDADKNAVNGDDKVKILLEQGLITAPPPKAEEPEPEAEEAAGDEAAAEEGGEEGGETEEASDD
ncbi:MAG: hypothetical protein AAF529_23420 [Pseudomonadota bacterium]